MAQLHQSRMTSEQRLNALMNYRKPDRVPIFGVGIRFCLLNCGYTFNELFTDQQKTFNAVRWTCEQYEWEPLLRDGGHTVTGSWDFGAKMKMPDSPYSGAISVETPAVQTEEEVWNLRLPDPTSAGAISQRMEFCRLQDREGWPITFFARSPFTMAANICGVEQFARWLIKKPELCDRLMRMALEHTLNVLQYWVNTFGAEKIVYYMSSPTESNQVISPRHLQIYALPYHKELHQRLRVIGVNKFMFHMCGEQNLNMPYLGGFASSVDGWPHPSILSFGAEVNLKYAAECFPDDIIMGNIEPALIQTGTPQQVYEECRLCIEKGKKFRGGFILGPGCELPPKAPPYNVWMLTKAANDFGWYE